LPGGMSPMIRKKTLPAQGEFWVCRSEIKVPATGGYYDGLGRDLDSEGFGEFVRALCAPYYSEGAGGRPPIDPEVYFKRLVVGFFEKVGSERGIAARCADSIAARSFLGYDLTEATPDHSSLSRIRMRLPESVYEEVFAFSHRPLCRAGLLRGEDVGLDSSTVEANASLAKLVRRDDGRSYIGYIKELAAAAGVDPEDTDAVIRFDRAREGKKTSNAEWVSPNDPDAKIGPRKDGAWDMIHKVENAVDLGSGAILSAEVQPADKPDAQGMAAHLECAAANAAHAAVQLAEEAAKSEGKAEVESKVEVEAEAGAGAGAEVECEEVRCIRAVCDKGYHKLEEMEALAESGIEPVVSVPAGRKVPVAPGAAEVFEANRDMVECEEGKDLLGLRAEKVERSFRHMPDHGGARRTTLNGHINVAKRMFIAAFAFNMSIYTWNMKGEGTAKQAMAGNRNRAVVSAALEAAKIASATLRNFRGRIFCRRPRKIANWPAISRLNHAVLNLTVSGQFEGNSTVS
jgi:transposase